MANDGLWKTFLVLALSHISKGDVQQLIKVEVEKVKVKVHGTNQHSGGDGNTKSVSNVINGATYTLRREMPPRSLGFFPISSSASMAVIGKVVKCKIKMTWAP